MIQMTQSGNGVDVLTAPAGAGKTFAFAAARDAWERAGYRVIGAAHTGVAADELAMAAGIPSTTIARLLIAIDRGEPGGLDDRTVLVDRRSRHRRHPRPRPPARRGRAHRRQGRARPAIRSSSPRSPPAACSPPSPRSSRRSS